MRWRNGTPATDDDRDLIRLLLSAHLRSENISERPVPGDEVTTRAARVRHTLDPIVNFFTVYRRKRKMSVKTVASLFGEQGSTVSGYETGKARPFIEKLRDWGFALGFDIMPVPIAMRKHVMELVNTHLEELYQRDLNYWAEKPGAIKSYREEANVHADFSPGSEFLRDGDHLGSPATGEAESRGLPDSGTTGGGEYEVDIS